MKKLFIIPILLMLAFSVQAQWPNPKVRWVDVYPVVNMTLSGTQTSSTAFNVPVDMSWSLRVRCTSVSNTTGYIKMQFNDVSTGTFVTWGDSVLVSSATFDHQFVGQFNPNNWWKLVYTCTSATTGTISATLTGSLNVKY